MSDAIDEEIDLLEKMEKHEIEYANAYTNPYYFFNGKKAALKEIQRDHILVPRSEVPEGLSEASQDLQPSIGRNGGDVFRRDTGERVYDCGISSAKKLQQAAALLAEQMEDGDDT